VLASTVPTCVSYDPAYVYELAVVLQDGIAACTRKGEDCFYYITMYNEDYAMPAMPEGAASRRHSARHLQVQAAAEGRGARCSCSAAARS
jgi:pyruvate dehydrogenase complex dehydrogenase (E1) component